MLVNIIVESWGIWVCASYFLCGLFMFLEHLPTETKNAQGALDVLCYVICIDMWRLSVCKWGNRAQNSLSNQDTRAESLITAWNLWQQGFLQGGKSPAVRSCHLWPHGQLYSEANYSPAQLRRLQNFLNPTCVLWEADDHRATLHHRPCRFLHYPGQNMWFSKAQTEPNMYAYCEMGVSASGVWQPIWLVVWNMFFIFSTYW